MFYENVLYTYHLFAIIVILFNSKFQFFNIKIKLLNYVISILSNIELLI